MKAGDYMLHVRYWRDNSTQVFIEQAR